MFSHDLKRWIKENLGIANVRVTSSSGKSQFVNALIPAEKRGKFSDPMVYKYAFPQEFGRHCLAIIYGPEFLKPGQSAYAGNVNPHYITMNLSQWQRAMETWNATNLE